MAIRTQKDKMMRKLLHSSMILFCSCFVVSSCNNKPHAISAIEQQPAIFPDYIDIDIPVNICPLNFVVKEKADKYFVLISGNKSKHKIEIKSQNEVIGIPLQKWHKLLQENFGDTVTVSVSIFFNHEWKTYKSFNWRIRDPIDEYLFYRYMGRDGASWKFMGISQRNLTNFEEKYVFQNNLIDNSCMNCHTFCNNNPDTMMLHVRNKHAGTFIKCGNEVQKIAIKSNDQLKGVYSAWHPSGRFIAFSTSHIQTIHWYNKIYADQYTQEEGSNIILYDVEQNKIINCEALSMPGFQKTYPNFSPDGKFLYFGMSKDSANINSIRKMDQIKQTKYSLVRIKFDAETVAFGEIETVVSPEQIGGGSVSYPCVSPDGKSILFNVTAFSTMDPPGSIESDLWSYFPETNTVVKQEAANSPFVESFHSWSSNGKWFVVSSHRLSQGIWTRPFFSYVDKNGIAGKAFVLPLKNPNDYDEKYAFNLPTLGKRPIEINPYDFEQFIRKQAVEPGQVTIDK